MLADVFALKAEALGLSLPPLGLSVLLEPIAVEVEASGAIGVGALALAVGKGETAREDEADTAAAIVPHCLGTGAATLPPQPFAVFDGAGELPLGVDGDRKFAKPPNLFPGGATTLESKGEGTRVSTLRRIMMLRLGSASTSSRPRRYTSARDITKVRLAGGTVDQRLNSYFSSDAYFRRSRFLRTEA